jgi:hypothetical protein
MRAKNTWSDSKIRDLGGHACMALSLRGEGVIPVMGLRNTQRQIMLHFLRMDENTTQQLSSKVLLRAQSAWLTHLLEHVAQRDLHREESAEA